MRRNHGWIAIVVLVLVAIIAIGEARTDRSPEGFIDHLIELFANGKDVHANGKDLSQIFVNGARLHGMAFSGQLLEGNLKFPKDGWYIQKDSSGKMAWFTQTKELDYDSDYEAEYVIGGVLIKKPTWKIVELNVTGVPDSTAPTSFPLSALSFNIRYGTANDGTNSWYNRDHLVFKVFNDYKPNFVGVQEALFFQLEEIVANVAGYKWIGVGRDNGATAGEFSAIFYQSEFFDVLEQGTFWYCNTPTVPGCTSYGNSIPRICTWGKFIHKATGKIFYFYNTHLDHQSTNSREKSAQQLIDHINSQVEDGSPVLITGDFNNGAESATEIKIVKNAGFEDTFRVLYPNATNVGTFHGFGGNTAGTKIDFVFGPTSPRFGDLVKVIGASIIHDNENGRYPSDHFPVLTEVVIPVA